MSDAGEHEEVVVGVDPARDWRLPLAWAVDEAARRRLRLRLVVAVPPQHDTQHVDDTPRSMALHQAASEASTRLRPGAGIDTRRSKRSWTSSKASPLRRSADCRAMPA